jgi:hypothetical protein
MRAPRKKRLDVPRSLSGLMWCTCAVVGAACVPEGNPTRAVSRELELRMVGAGADGAIAGYNLDGKLDLRTAAGQLVRNLGHPSCSILPSGSSLHGRSHDYPAAFVLPTGDLLISAYCEGRSDVGLLRYDGAQVTEELDGAGAPVPGVLGVSSGGVAVTASAQTLKNAAGYPTGKVTLTLRQNAGQGWSDWASAELDGESILISRVLVGSEKDAWVLLRHSTLEGRKDLLVHASAGVLDPGLALAAISAQEQYGPIDPGLCATPSGLYTWTREGSRFVTNTGQVSTFRAEPIEHLAATSSSDVWAFMWFDTGKTECVPDTSLGITISSCTPLLTLRLAHFDGTRSTWFVPPNASVKWGVMPRAGAILFETVGPNGDPQWHEAP